MPSGWDLRSRNDQVALDLRLYLRDEIDLLIEGLRRFQKALVTMAAANPRVIMPGFTHLQHAQVVLFAHHLLAYVEMFDRDAERLADCRKRVNVMPLGSGALAGSTLPLDRELVCKELNFERVTRNSMDGVADRDFGADYYVRTNFTRLFYVNKFPVAVVYHNADVLVYGTYNLNCLFYLSNGNCVS